MAPQSLSFSLQSTLGYQCHLCLLRDRRGRHQAGRGFYFSKYGLFSESAVNHQGAWGRGQHVFSLTMCLSASSFFSVGLSFSYRQGDLGYIWAPFSLYLRTSLSVASKNVSVFFQPVFSPTLPGRLSSWQINSFWFHVSCIAPPPNGEHIRVSVTDPKVRRACSHCWSVTPVPGPRLTFPYGTRANGPALPLSL